jgi:hypothetical protein
MFDAVRRFKTVLSREEEMNRHTDYLFLCAIGIMGLVWSAADDALGREQIHERSVKILADLIRQLPEDCRQLLIESADHTPFLFHGKDTHKETLDVLAATMEAVTGKQYRSEDGWFLIQENKER